MMENTMLVLTSLAAAGVFAAVMWIAYRLAHTKATYQPKFAATLVTLAFVSNILMDLIRSYLALSLGMLGSLSIVRFRTNIKDPRDIGFIFWSMAAGLAASTQSYLIGAVGSLVLTAVMMLTKKSTERPEAMLLVVRGSDADLDRVQEIVDQTAEQSSVKAKNVLADSFELVYEVQIPQKRENAVIENIFELGGIDSVNLLAPSMQAC